MDSKTYFEGVESYRLLAKHEVGQNFLVDPNVAKRIVDTLEVKEGERVLEIGCGAGSLTYFLSLTPGKVTAIDIDEALLAKLQNDFQGKVDVIYGNATKFDYAPYDKIIGNLPYYITSLIIEKALLGAKKASRMAFMVQKEAGERLLSKPGTKDYGPLPILISLCCDAKKAFVVRRNSFAPAPHVDSLVVTLEMGDPMEDSLPKAYALSQSLFLQRRKTLYNNLKNYLHDGAKAKALLAGLSLSETIRPEQVTPEQYLALAKSIG
ncbi:MAG: 16S rRNA (adenine(1518)-N(6)/adenine(1519)-N(6))-dimethyltransferase RsmA [Bacilli bacterium]|nr:16S rRNA (adenine(1518)-N(6)/adenine(1519)-N(6))-dimethyltransferase RsmA [Bacilli bacterium]